MIAPPPRRPRALARWSPLALAAMLACTEDIQLASSAVGIGGACRSDSECQTGMCYLGRVGGYCTKPCNVEGAPCTDQALCKPVQGGARQCLVVCGVPSTCGRQTCPPESCPTGSSCVSTTAGAVKVCEPLP